MLCDLNTQTNKSLAPA